MIKRDARKNCIARHEEFAVGVVKRLRFHNVNPHELV